MIAVHTIADILERMLEQQQTLVREMEESKDSSGVYTDPHASKLLSSKEMCQELNISLSTLYHYVKKFDFPVYRIGQKHYYRLSEVYDYMIKKRKV